MIIRNITKNLAVTFIITISLISQAHSFNFEGCISMRGKSIPTKFTKTIPTLAAAFQDPVYGPFILINTSLMKKYKKSPAFQSFIYWHECGHHALAHLFNQITIPKEQEADCYGIRVAITLGQINYGQLPELQSLLNKFGPGDWQHLPGPNRAINLRVCLGSKFSEKSLISCKKQLKATLNQYRQASKNLPTMAKICDQYGDKSAQCLQVQTLSKKLDSGLLSSMKILDSNCPFVVTPEMSLVIANYSDSFLEVKRHDWKSRFWRGLKK